MRAQQKQLLVSVLWADQGLGSRMPRALCTVCCHGHSLLGQDHGCLNAQGVRQCPWGARGNPQWCGVLCSQPTVPPVLTSLGTDLPSLGTDLGASGVQHPLPLSTPQAAVSCSAWPRPRGICPLCPQPHLTAAAPLSGMGSDRGSEHLPHPRPEWPKCSWESWVTAAHSPAR